MQLNCHNFDLGLGTADRASSSYSRCTLTVSGQPWAAVKLKCKMGRYCGRCCFHGSSLDFVENWSESINTASYSRENASFSQYTDICSRIVPIFWLFSCEITPWENFTRIPPVLKLLFHNSDQVVQK